jgi:hypothetical protein
MSAEPIQATSLTSSENAMTELDRARWAIYHKHWILAQVYTNHALQWIKQAQREHEEEP